MVNELERIDDECDDHGIVFVKISNAEEAIEHGIEHLPTLVYFENEIPSVYQGDAKYNLLLLSSSINNLNFLKNI